MMRAFAAVAAAAVAVVALPTAAGAAAQAVGDTETVASSQQPAQSGVLAFLSERSLLGMSVGALLWLSVAVLAAVVAITIIARSRHSAAETAVDAALAGGTVARPEFARSDVATATR